ncbi:sec-independent protein translocase protein TatB [Novosphingobium kunmingense]|uniref:Sec-independent protein translocase protein TatB n=1 Tax=Novosphingobium kunmingense TaxID=1211806 RepID=A0A2N0HKW8_9SPHN|nr:Sec-independent protein translocase protein TatB [Novosphingobium kunmingense]PKB19528.1 sec-independent protein translocase protein TatB [Novosphingobium kunmingense]
MFDIGWDEMLFTAIVAIVVIGPKDLPRALRTAGQWIGKIRRVSGHFRSGIETMIREAEMEDMEKKWREQNDRIMAQTPPGWNAAEANLVGPDPGIGTGAPPLMTELPAPAEPPAAAANPDAAAPELPLGSPKAG